MPALLDENATVAAPAGLPVGPDQGVIEEAKHRRRSRRLRIALGGMLAAAGLAGVAWALGAGGSSANPAHTRPAGGAVAGSTRASAAAGFNLRLSPALSGGQYGWCVGIEEQAGVIGDGGCAMAPVASTPLAMELSSGSMSRRQESIVVLSTPTVAAILVNGRWRVRTLALPGLPYGLRAAHISIPLPLETSAGGRRGIAALPQPKLVALDARGHAIANRVMREAPVPVNRTGRGPCTLHTGGLAGLQEQWSHVAAAIRPFPGKLIGRGFFSCIDTEYYLHNWPLDAAILLDAAHPGVLPAAIPGLEPVRGEHGYFNGPGDFKGELTAMRFGDAWLVLAGGSGVAQRIEVLRHLTPTVTL
jgi:hypothetical protein